MWSSDYIQKIPSLTISTLKDETMKDVLGVAIIVVGLYIAVESAGNPSEGLVQFLTPTFGVGAALIIDGGAVIRYVNRP